MTSRTNSTSASTTSSFRACTERLGRCGFKGLGRRSLPRGGDWRLLPQRSASPQRFWRKHHWRQGELLFLPASGCWSPAEKPSDPVHAFPAIPVRVARKPPATRALEADHVRRWAGAAADAAVLASRAFDCWHTSPLTMDREVRQYGIENRLSTP
jgi:hypothetical protein